MRPFDIALANKLNWLFEQALPFWASMGTDWTQGGFQERFAQDGAPIVNIPRRTRVVARQIFVFAAAGRLGWKGDWEAIINHGATALFERCIQPDGLVLSTYWPDGKPQNTDFDLYDHAFALFALGELARYPRYNDQALTAAEAMMDAIERRFHHSEKGFLENEAGAPPLRANPHMHLLEAFLVLEQVPHASLRWRRCADDIVALAIERFIDFDSGGLREFFTSNWSPMPDESGRIIEPGHQFEWSWLLHRWNADVNDRTVAAKADRLCDIGEAHGLGIDAATVIDELWDDFTIRTATARNWPTTERIKACLQRAGRSAVVGLWEDRATAGLEALSRFIDTSVPGLWHDRLSTNLVAIPGPCAASSLYHIVCALEESHRYMIASHHP